MTITSGGTPIGSDIDFAGRYLTHVLGFIGLEDVTLVAADQRNVDPDAARQRAATRIEAWVRSSAVSDPGYPRRAESGYAIAELNHD